MLLRRAGVEDVNGIMAIHEAAIREICSRDYPADVIDAWLAQRQRSKQLKHVQTCSVWIVEEHQTAIGFGGIDLTSMRVESLFVDPKGNGRGVASMILRQLEREAVEGGSRKIELDSSLSAMRFYAAKGFVPTGVRTSLKLSDTTSLEGVAMSKELSNLA